MPEVRDILEELRARWLLQGAPIARLLLPGATEQELDAAEQHLGFPLSIEVRDWYGFHNGYEYVPGQPCLWPPRFFPGSLDEAVRDHHTSRAEAQKFTSEAAGIVEFTFGVTWVALSRPSKVMVVADNDLAGLDPHADSGVHFIDFAAPQDWQTLQLPSVTALVHAWLQLTEQGTLRYNATRGDWEDDWDAIPASLRIRDIIV